MSSDYTAIVAGSPTADRELHSVGVGDIRSVSRSESRRAAVTVIEPSRGWRGVNVRELWQFRELLYFLTWRDVKVRYKQTLLGVAWAILQPAMMMIVFTVFFARMAKVPAGDVPYPLFVYAGLLPWTFFSTAITHAANSVVGSERLITKVYFPRLAIPFASVGAAFVDFCIAFGLLALLILWYGVVPGPAILLVPLLCVSLALAAAGVGTLLAALNVAYRDFRYIIPFLIHIWMFATPTIYMNPEHNGPGIFEYLMHANPLVALVAAFRSVVLGGAIPWASLVIAVVASLALFFVGCLSFRRLEDRFSDVI
jgi:lipopolysaccharide transport system permease protein